ncbi:response regulator [Pedobacter sp. G11]|nr:response regulator [Pedobacter sp. G11]
MNQATNCRLRLFFNTAIISSLSILLFSACKHKDENKPYKIGFSQCVASDHWRRTMLDEMKMELSLHSSTKFIYKDADGDSKRQISQVREMLRFGLDLLIISPNEAHPLTKVVNEAHQLGIPVIVIDRKTSSQQYTAYVGANNYEVGRLAGEYMANVVLKKKGNIIEVMGLPGSSPTIERSRGFADAIQNYPQIKLDLQVYGNWVRAEAVEQLNKYTAKIKTADAVFAHNDVMAKAASDVINRLHSGGHIKIIGVDALPGEDAGLELVAGRKLTASLLYPTGGKEAIKAAFAILNHDNFSKENILPSLVIDSANVELMKMQWERINSQRKDIEVQKSLLEDQLEIYNNQRLVLNIIVITLVLVVVFGGLAFHALLENRKINKSLELKNSEILDQKNQLLEMSEKAEKATEAKLKFFTNISHEFRTPLTLIISPLEDLLADEKLRGTIGKQLNMINKNVFRLLKLVNELIDYRKIEHNKFKLNVTPANITDFLKEVISHFKHLSEKRNISLQLYSKEPQLILWFDPNILDKVFFNLLSNALKFTPDNGRISIQLYKDENDLNITVEDTGTGMTEAVKNHIFDPFYQADEVCARGSGLGLSLSKELIQLHHGSIDVESEKWKGTRFLIQLPLGRDCYPEGEMQQKFVQQTRLYDQVKIYSSDLDQKVINEPEHVFNPLKEHSILIIEDNKDLLSYLTDKFESTYEVYTASNGTSAINAAYEKIPDLIISDIIIPEMTGTALANRFKTDMRTSHIPIILLTAKGSIEQQIDGIQSMADLYITKPFNFAYLKANVENLIRNRDILREHYTSDISVPVNRKNVANGLDKKFLNDLAGIVEHNLSNENFNVEHLCQEIGVSRIQLYRKVKALLDTTITEYILNRRLKKAKYYLSHHEYSIAEVTYMVGISSPNYFSTVFKTKYGFTPSEFKKSVK